MSRFAVPALLLLCLAAAAPGNAAETAATLRFATACAICHEGECSGRLSFARRPQAAAAHIRQYAGPVDDTLATRLYAALEQMKSACRYAELPLADLARAHADNALAPYRDPWSGGYFFALGPLREGEYRLHGEVNGESAVRIELIDDTFEPLTDACVDSHAGRFAITLQVSQRRPLYLRLRPRDKRPLQRLQLTISTP